MVFPIFPGNGSSSPYRTNSSAMALPFIRFRPLPVTAAIGTYKRVSDDKKPIVPPISEFGPLAFGAEASVGRVSWLWSSGRRGTVSSGRARKTSLLSGHGPGVPFEI
jgi:hypothetical protein